LPFRMVGHLWRMTAWHFFTTQFWPIARTFNSWDSMVLLEVKYWHLL